MSFADDDEEEVARQSARGPGGAQLPVLDAARRAQLAAMEEPCRTVSDDVLARALRGELAPEDIARPSEFYEHLVRKVQRTGSSITINDYDTVWRVCAKQFDVRPAKKPDRWSQYRRSDAAEEEENAGKGKGGRGDKGKGKGKGSDMFAACAGLRITPGLLRRARGPPEEGVQPWWSGLRAGEYIRVWNVQGGPWGHGVEPALQSVERLVPVPVSVENPELWRAHSQESRVRSSSRWPALRQELAARTTVETMESCVRAHCVAAAFRDWHDVHFLVRSAACGTGWAYVELDEPYRVPNYVEQEHAEVMRGVIAEELRAGRIFLAGWRLPVGVIAMGMVEKVRKGKVKFRPVSDYSRPKVGGVNSRIALDSDEFVTVKEAFALLRPGCFMVKVDLENAYRTAAEAEENMMLLVEFVSFLGFSVNMAKCEGPARRMEFLGILLSTDRWTVCTAAIDSDRVKIVLTRAESAAGAGSERQVTRRTVRMAAPVLEDLAVLERVLRMYNGRQGALHRRVVDESHFATDASGTLGLGGGLGEALLPPQLGGFSADAPEIMGTTVVVNIDNQSALFQIKRWWGAVAYLLLLKQLFYSCSKHDIRLQPVYISSKDNLLADLLSRLQLARVHATESMASQVSKAVAQQDRTEKRPAPEAGDRRLLPLSSTTGRSSSRHTSPASEDPRRRSPRREESSPPNRTPGPSERWTEPATGTFRKPTKGVDPAAWPLKQTAGLPRNHTHLSKLQLGIIHTPT
ncbi:hypothetical protein CYMTET_20504 [Cymbomonas tetramitiformis]|uniref:Reverse transcriptase domain-containing protein n=1 Tax=Cymbomonas tetramitiformis TaxID=36881 RepID=A0AAE0G3W3_9CHLO|nr:hypothetical protein CYMTET_20504 [Cymbomonas tetramitiformis]